MACRPPFSSFPYVATLAALLGACGGRSDLNLGGGIPSVGAGGDVGTGAVGGAATGGVLTSGGAGGEATGGVPTSGGSGFGGFGAGVFGGSPGTGALSGSGGGSFGGFGGAGGSGTGGSATGGGGEPSSCPPGLWDENYPNGPENCVSWTTCVPGQYVVAFGTDTEDRQCAPCEIGTFSEIANEPSCEPWTECEFWEDPNPAGTPSSDAVCAPPPEFVPIATSFGGASLTVGPDLAATADGLFVTGRYNSTFLAKYSFDGKQRSIYNAPEDPSEPNSILAVGEDLFVAGSELGSPTSVTQLGFLAEFDAVPDRLGKQNLGLADSATRGVMVASDGTDLYLAGAYFPPACAGSCGPADQGYLYWARLDGDLNVLEDRKDILLPSEDTPTIHGLEVLEDGTLVVLGGGSSEQTRFSIEVSSDGATDVLLGLPELGCTNCAGLSTEPGGLLTMVGNRITPDGTALGGQAIRVRGVDGSWSEAIIVPESDDDVYEDLLVTSTGIYLVGQDTLTEDAVFVELDLFGMQISRVVLGNQAGTERATSVVEAPDGKIYAAGVSDRGASRAVFVVPWPL